MSYEITTDDSLSPSTKPQILSFLSAFYQTSDTESAHAKYVSNFTSDATLIMGAKKATGSDGILLYLQSIFWNEGTRTTLTR